jgi:DNA-binding LytR/AlgR family response regulator
MKYNISICDDEINQCNLIKEYINTYKNKNDLDFNIYIANNSKECINIINKNIIDIAFLDVQIDDKTGLDLAKEIRKTNKDTIIVFITGFREYGYKAFEVNALNYIIKPITEDKFVNELNRIFKKIDENKYLHTNKYNKLVLTTKEGTYRINYSDILYFEKMGKHVYVVCDNGNTIKVRTSLRIIQKDLDENQFIKCHQGYVVNKEKIYSYKLMKLYVGEERLEVPVSKANINKIKKVITQILWG